LKVLITDGLSKEGLSILESSGKLDIDERKGIPKEELLEIIKDYDAVIIRSATKLTSDIIEAAGANLMAIGRAGIGVDNVDLEQATKRGIVVMNTPEANAITTAEHTITILLSLARKIPQAHSSLIAGKWERNKFKGVELYGKTIGFIGLGNIGKLVAERAIGLRMKAIAYDPYLNEEAASKIGVSSVKLDELLKNSDIVTIHTPLNKETRNLINKDSINKMKDGVIIINCARGGIVNEADLFEAIKSGRIAGAALDVYENEPPDKKNPLFSLKDNVVFTPHLGASTEEAQTKVGVAIAEQVSDFLLNGVVRNAVNMPSLSGEMLKKMRPYLNLAEKLGSLHGQLCKGAIKEVDITYSGEVSFYDIVPITVSAIKGLLSPIMDMVISPVNAPVIAKERGIKIVESRSTEPQDYTSLIALKVTTDEGVSEISGTIFGKEEPRFVKINGVSIDVIPQGFLLVSENYDRPGFIGSMTSLLGKHNVNIGLMHLGRKSIGGRAIVFINVDSPVSQEAIDEISRLPDIISVAQVKF